jgi:hypothetical protein
MTEELKLLSVIQSIDARILAARTELERIPRDIDRLETERRRHQDVLNQARSQREASAKNRRVLELEVESRAAAIRKLQAQQIQVKTNKEYTAMLHEIEGTKRAISGLEERILVEMENGDSLAAAEQESHGTYDAESGRIGREQDVLRSRAAELQSGVDRLSADRERSVAGLPKDILTAYQRIFQGRSGRAIVTVEQHACGGCGAPLPPQLVNEVRKMDELITCETCGRILVWNQEPK